MITYAPMCWRRNCKSNKLAHTMLFAKGPHSGLKISRKKNLGAVTIDVTSCSIIAMCQHRSNVGFLRKRHNLSHL